MPKAAKDKPLKWLSSYQKSPHAPGVYWFMDADKNVIYVGKAKDLKNRLASYTQLKQIHGKTLKMVIVAKYLKYEVQESELVSLLVEAELIRLHQPHFNVQLKDDKSPLYIYITNDKYPVIKTIRKKELKRFGKIEGIKNQNIFGPFPSAFRTKEVLKIIRPIFRWCDNPDGGRPCFYYHLQRCSGACVGAVTEQEYARQIESLKLFLRGKTKQVKDRFKAEMDKASATQDYERAAWYRDAILSIEILLKPRYKLKPDLKLPKLVASQNHEGLLHLRNEVRQFYPLPSDYPLTRIEGYDVSNIMGQNASVSMVVMTNGEADKAEYRLFNIRSINTPNDYQMMKEAVTRRQKHPEWGLPNLVVIDGGRGQLRAALSIWGWETPIVSLVKRPDRLVIPVFADPNNRSIVNLKYHMVEFPPDHPTLRLLQRLRDESHRFAKKQHTRLRNRAIISR